MSTSNISLVARNCRALVRLGKEVPAGATPVEGDLLDADSLKQAVEGVSVIVHLAAVFVYGDGDGHLAALPEVVARFKWRPAKTFSLVHQRGVARAVELALTGTMDGRIVNIVDHAPTTVYEIARLVGSPIEPSAEPLTDP
jgi:nucleoside-diphosphate-sugar epimerase